MKDKPLTDAAWRFLGDLGEARARYARRCPAISVEAAWDWGMEGATALRKAMQGDDPLIESIDGEPCLQDVPDRPRAPQKYRQEALL